MTDIPSNQNLPAEMRGRSPFNEDPHSEFYVPEEFIGNPIPPNWFCRGWNSKRGKYCRARSGAGTDHPGQGRCRNHGGKTPIVHGRYSEVPRGALAEIHDQLELESDEDKLNILPEATLLRALASAYVEQFEDFMHGVIRFNHLEGEEAAIEKRKPMYINPPSIQDVAAAVMKSAEVIDKVHKQRSANAISLKEFLRVMGLMSDIVVTNVRALEQKLRLTPVQCEEIDRALEKIGEEWKGLKYSKTSS